MNTSSTPYLFIELAAIIYLIAFCGPHLRLHKIDRASLWKIALCLGGFWFGIDQVAVWLGLWAFPVNGTLRFRLFALPFEEYIVFFLHTLVCYGLLQRRLARE